MQGILFNVPTGMYNAVIDETKDLTRRLGGLRDINENPDEWEFINKINGAFNFVGIRPNLDHSVAHILCKPKYKVGEILYIKESHCITIDEDGNLEVIYKVDNPDAINDIEDAYPGEEDNKSPKWSNPMFCGEYDKMGVIKIARHYIKVLSIRVERLQDISTLHASREGITISHYNFGIPHFKDYSRKPGCFTMNIKESFSSLINKINGKGTWEGNPWVFVYEFQKVKL